MKKPILKTLPNGLRVLVIPEPNALTLTTLVLVGTGSKYETKAENGLSHFLEHMCFKGTTALPSSRAVMETFDRIGSVVNAFTSNEYTGYYAKGSPKHLKKFVTVLSDIYMNSTFPEKEIEKEKGVVIEEINMYEDIPQHRVGQALTTLVYGDQPVGWPILGTKETVRSFTRQDFMRYKTKHYHAKNTIVVVSGPVEVKDVQALVLDSFGKLDASAATKKKKVAVSKKTFKSVVVNKKSDQAHMVLGFHSLPYGHRDNPAIGLLATVLGRGMSSRLFQVLREEMGAAYYVSCGNDTQTDTGLFEISAGIDSSRPNVILERICSMLSSMKETLISEQELQKALEYTLGMMRLGLESSDDMAGFYGAQVLMKGGFKTFAEIASEYKAVTAMDIRRVARKIFVAENCSLAVLREFTVNDIDTKPFRSL